MYICGASVKCKAMMTFATDNIDETTYIIERIIPISCHQPDIRRFHEPLRQALTMLFEQPNSHLMGPMRLAMARLVDVCFLYLILNRGFKTSFESRWMPWLFANCARDNDYFRRVGGLDPQPQTSMMELVSSARQQEPVKPHETSKSQEDLKKATNAGQKNILGL
jgi:hypothetical protein